MKLEREFRGIEFIRLSDLPDELQQGISNWLNDDILIKIKTDEGLFADCILLKDFHHWYHHIYTPVNDLSETDSKRTVKRRGIKFAFER